MGQDPCTVLASAIERWLNAPINNDYDTTLHVLLQVEREVEAELREQNIMGRFSDKAKLVTEKLRATEDKLTLQLDAMIDELDNGIPQRAEVAMTAARAAVGELSKGVDDIEIGLKHLSNSGNSEERPEGLKDPT